MITTRAAVKQLVEDVRKAESETWRIIDDEKRAAHGYFDDERTRRKLFNLKDRAQSLARKFHKLSFEPEFHWISA